MTEGDAPLWKVGWLPTLLVQSPRLAAKDSKASPLLSSTLEPQYVDLALKSPATRRV